MRLWRSSNHADLSGDGGLLAAGRWHSYGNRIVYLADHPASALLEFLVHLEVDAEDIPDSFQLLAVDFPASIEFQSIGKDDVPASWSDDIALTREMGDRWLRDNLFALLRVPSAIVPYAMNWLLNPLHPEGAKAQIAEIIRAPFDPRLFRPSLIQR